MVTERTLSGQDLGLTEAIERDRRRLIRFIRRHVADPADAEDILQDVLYELVEAYRRVNPVEHVTAWLFRVARNRIADLFRSRAREIRPSGSAGGEDAPAAWEDFLPSKAGGPDAAFARRVLLEELDDALDELPPAQRDVFIAHEIEGLSFREIAARTGVPVNTLLSRKHHAVLHLRRRLQAIHDEYGRGR